jgi:hypothetical protein
MHREEWLCQSVTPSRFRNDQLPLLAALHESVLCGLPIGTARVRSAEDRGKADQGEIIMTLLAHRRKFMCWDRLPAVLTIGQAPSHALTDLAL